MTMTSIEQHLVKRGRARTTTAKRQVIDRIYAAWVLEPELRLGQLLDNALKRDLQDRLYDVEDEVLAGIVAGFVRRQG